MWSHRFDRWFLRLADPEGRREPGEWPKGLDQGWLCRFADWHGVLPAVVRNVEQWYMKRRGFEPGELAEKAAGGTGLPARAASLRECAEGILRPRLGFALLLRKRLEGIEAALAAAGVPAVVIKGRAFADRLYPDPSLRPFTDLDLLLPAEALEEAGQVLAELGYRRAREPGGKYPGEYAEQTWRRDDTVEWAVELHWNLVNSPPLRRRCSVGFGDLALEPPSGEALRRPTASSLLLIAGVHAAMSHRFDRLQPLCDVAQAARGAAGPLEPQWLAETAERTGSGFALGAALRLAGAACEEPACDELAAGVAPGHDGLLARRVVSPRAVVHSRGALARARRQLFRELLKRL